MINIVDFIVIRGQNNVSAYFLCYYFSATWRLQLNFAAIVSYISFVELEKLYKMALIKLPSNRNPIAHALCAGSFRAKVN